MLSMLWAQGQEIAEDKIDHHRKDQPALIIELPYPPDVVEDAIKDYLNSKTNEVVKIPDSYFLIDHANANSMKPQFMLAAGEYYNLSFIIGIDHARNMNGPHTGQLDPSLGMYWNATDGHIMAVSSMTRIWKSD